jgi:hypothetical protein
MGNKSASLIKEIPHYDLEYNAKCLEKFLLGTRGGEIRTGSMAAFYKEYPGVGFTYGLRQFVLQYPGIFIYSNDGLSISLANWDLSIARLVVDYTLDCTNNSELRKSYRRLCEDYWDIDFASCADSITALFPASEDVINTLLGKHNTYPGGIPKSDAEVLRDWVESEGGTVLVGKLGLFYDEHPYVQLRGGLRSFIATNENMFNVFWKHGQMHTIQVRSNHSSTSTQSRYQLLQASPSENENNGNLANVSLQQRQNTPSKKTHLPPLQARRYFEQNREGIIVEPEPSKASETGFIPLMPVTFTIHNNSNKSQRINRVKICDPRINCLPCELELALPLHAPCILRPGYDAEFTIQWKSDCPKGKVRLHVAQVEFIFDAGFAISRFIALDAGGGENKVALEMARPKSQYFPKRRRQQQVNFTQPDSFPGFIGKSQPLRLQLPRIPLMRNIVRADFFNHHPCYLPDYEHYKTRAETLLHLNLELDRKELEESDLLSVCYSRRSSGFYGKSLYWFEVPGLAEKRPSVIVGDKVIVQEVSGRVACVGGVIQVVERTEVGILFKLDNVVMSSRNRYNVRFLPNQYPFEMAFLAVSYATDPFRGFLRRIFSPVPVPMSFHDNIYFRLTRYPEYSKLNRAQKIAVAHICFCMPPTRLAPFLLFGPPGTGKTTTLVAAVFCILKSASKHRKAKILVTASSNSACDVFYDKLVAMLERNNLPPDTMVIRLLSSSLAPEPVDIESLEDARVIIATCVTSGKLVSLEGDSFTHVFMDEAAQTTEPESLIPLAMVARACEEKGNYCQLILGGDHKQLGPVIRDPELCNKAKMDVSLFERLMCYREYGELNSLYAVQLNENYRSHPCLVSVPSRLFYGGRLLAVASHQAFAEWNKLPTPGVPLIIHNVAGKEDREDTSPSWFNLAECDRVMHYIRQLQQSSQIQDVETDVVVIAPYAGQIRKMRIFLREAGLERLRVDSVEKFQGGEARVVIVSTCRSSSMNDDYDAKYHVGFLRNEKRFNVAITRAQELLIVVGNVKVLQTDSHWSQLISYGLELGALKW